MMPQVYSVEARQISADELTILAATLDPAPLGAARCGIPFPRNWHIYQVPRPTDLVALLQHFII